MNNKKTKIKMITKWIELSEKLNEINKYLYNHTECFEEKYMSDYETNLFNFFAGKITRHARDLNNLYDILTEKEIEQIKIEKLLN